MLTVLPIQSKEMQRELCEACGIEFILDAFAYRADDEKFIGICQFTFKGECGYIENLTYAPGMDDSEAMIIMLRATMSFMHRCGLKCSIIKDNATVDSLIKLSGYFRNENGQLFIDLDKFYGTKCSH